MIFYLEIHPPDLPLAREGIINSPSCQGGARGGDFHAPFASDEIMMTTHTSGNLLIALSDQLIDSSPLHGAVHSFPPITLQVVSESDREPLWDRAVQVDIVIYSYYMEFSSFEQSTNSVYNCSEQ